MLSEVTNDERHHPALIDWESGIAQSARATALAPFLPPSNRDLLLAIERHDTSVQREQLTSKQQDIIAEGLRRYAAELGVVEQGHVTSEEVERAAREYSTQIGAYPAFADTVQAIQRLGKRYQLVPVSNVDHASFRETLAGPLQGCHFDRIYTAEDIGSYKPDVRNFYYLLDHVKSELGVEKEELCHVAQSLFHDHGPAKQVGLQGVWVDRKGFMGGDTTGAEEKYGFKLRVETLQELADIVEEAWAQG